jgi:hypothetical protein
MDYKATNSIRMLIIALRMGTMFVGGINGFNLFDPQTSTRIRCATSGSDWIWKYSMNHSALILSGRSHPAFLQTEFHLLEFAKC